MPDLRDEMKAPVEPLLPVEKKLIGWSLSLGLALLVVLVLINRAFPLLRATNAKGSGDDHRLGSFHPRLRLGRRHSHRARGGVADPG